MDIAASLRLILPQKDWIAVDVRHKSEYHSAAGGCQVISNDSVLGNVRTTQRALGTHEIPPRTLGTRPAGSRGESVYTYGYNETEEIKTDRQLIENLSTSLKFQGTGIQFGLAIAARQGFTIASQLIGGGQVTAQGISCFDTYVQVIYQVESFALESYKLERKRKLQTVWHADTIETTLGLVTINKVKNSRIRQVLIYDLDLCPINEDYGPVDSESGMVYARAEIGEHLICVPLRRSTTGGYLPYSAFDLKELEQPVGRAVVDVIAELEKQVSVVEKKEELWGK